MAEENVLEEDNQNLEDDNLLDELDEATGAEDEPTDESGAKSSGNPIDKIKGLMKNRRVVIIAGSVLVVLVLFMAVFVLTGSDEEDLMADAMLNQQEAPKFDSSNIVQKKDKKKKKRKIKYIDLYKQLDGTQLEPILRELSYLKIEFNVVQNGKQYDLQVDEESLNDAKNMLAIKGLPSGKAIGYEIFDTASNLGVTEFDKRIRLVRAISGEMEKSIMNFDAVDYANVEIVIPETKLFAVTQPPVTASILIKRTNGAEITDETVFAIMELVANSVESLEKENISVVDTEGRVLSTGVVNRIVEKNRVKEKEAAKFIAAGDAGSVGNGKIIIPEIEDVVDWFQLKYNYETVLEKKAHNQLNGVLPIGSYKTAVTIDLNSVTKTGAPNIKRIITSIVVDDQFDEVEFDEATITQINQAVAGAVGYEEGRDKIHVSKASFLPKRQTVSDILEEKTEIRFPSESLWERAKRVLRLWPIFFMGLLATTVLIVIYKMATSLIINIFNGVLKVFKVIWGAIKKVGQLLLRGLYRVLAVFGWKKKDEDPEVEISDTLPDDTDRKQLISPEEEIINKVKAKSDYSQVIQLKAMATQDIDFVVEELKELLKG